MSITELGRTGPLPRTAWADRVRVLAQASGVSVEGLGELVGSELTRLDDVLFTATSAEELDEVSRWQRLADAAWCGQVRTIVAMHNRMDACEREFLACEVALALNLTDGCVSDLVATALLAADAPGLVESVEAGILTVRHVHAVLRELAGCQLSSEEQHAVVLVALARYDRETPAELGTMVKRLILTVHGAAAAAKEADATYRRRVRVRAVEDGQGILVARGPLWMIEQMRAALAAQAAGLVGEEPDGEQSRTRDAVEFDLLHDLIVGRSVAAGTVTTAASIVVPVSTAEGGELELAEIPGLGPVLPATARDILAGADRVQRISSTATGRCWRSATGCPDRPCAPPTATPRTGCGDWSRCPCASAFPARRPAIDPLIGCAGTSRRGTGCAASPGAGGRRIAPTSTTATSGLVEPPRRRTCRPCADGTTAPRPDGSSRSCPCPTVARAGSRAAAGGSTTHHLCTDAARNRNG